MKVITVVLIVFLCLLQHRLWFGKNSVPDYLTIVSNVERQRADNDKLIQRNKVLYADTDDLKSGVEGIEERARNELGMIKDNETFFRIVPPKSAQSKQLSSVTSEDTQE